MITFKSSRSLLRFFLNSGVSASLSTAQHTTPFLCPEPSSTRRTSFPPLFRHQGVNHIKSQWPGNEQSVQLRYFTSTVLSAGPESAALRSLQEVDAIPDIDWENLGFKIHKTDQMFVMKCDKHGEWYRGHLEPYGVIELNPSAGVLNYGQGLFEGLKAYRTENGRLLLFRPEENAKRMVCGADRLCMPAPSVEVFVEAVKQTVLANLRWVPPVGKGALYIRPLLIGSGPVLGLATAPEYTFLIYVSPVGNYFEEGPSPIHLKTESVYARAVCGGTGGVKTICNYASVLKAQLEAKKGGFSDVVYLDALEKKYLEEVSSCNIFVVKGGSISTPETRGSILPGITRKSIMELANGLGYRVEEKQIHVDELLDADEVFCTGTAAVVSTVGSVTHQGTKISYSNSGSGKVARVLHDSLVNIQMGKVEDSHGWTNEV